MTTPSFQLLRSETRPSMSTLLVYSQPTSYLSTNPVTSIFKLYHISLSLWSKLPTSLTWITATVSSLVSYSLFATQQLEWFFKNLDPSIPLLKPSTGSHPIQSKSQGPYNFSKTLSDLPLQPPCTALTPLLLTLLQSTSLLLFLK